MKTTTILTAAVATLPLAHSLTLNHKRDASPRVFALDIEKRNPENLVEVSNSRHAKRGTVVETLDNEGTFYFANISLGTPAQTLSMTIDTGSSDLWTNAPNSSLCDAHNGAACSSSGTYNSATSSTYKFVNSEFNITYADGSGATGNYVTDTLRIGGKTLPDYEFGVGYVSSSGQGVLGVGYNTNEAAVQTTGQTYNNLPLALTSAGLIQAPAYSLWLNDLEASTGQILFGGVNTEKYHGDLQSLPILQEDGIFAEFFITLTGVVMTDGSGATTTFSEGLPTPVLLDSGSSLSYLPDRMIQDIYTQIGAQYDSSQGSAYVPCSAASGSFNFTFSSPMIQVQMQELLFGATDEQGNPLTFQNGDQACIFGISPAGESTAVLGDTFLRSAYVVYDLSSNEISLAQTNFNSTTDNIVEIASGTSGVPGATGVANPVTVAAATGTGFLGGEPTNGATVSLTGGTAGATATAGATSTAGAAPALAMPTGQAAMGYLVAGAALVAAAL